MSVFSTHALHHSIYLIVLSARPSLLSTLFPYTTLFRSLRRVRQRGPRAGHRLLLDAVPRGRAGLRLRRRRLLDPGEQHPQRDRKSTRLNSSHVAISYAVFCLKKKNSSRNKI